MSKMAKRKRIKSRAIVRRSYARIRRHLPKKMHIIPTMGFAATQLSNLGNGTVNEHGPIGGLILNLQSGDFVKAGRGFVRDELVAFSGFDLDGGAWKVPIGTLLVVGTGLISRYLGKFANPYLKQIPVIGNKIAL